MAGEIIWALRLTGLKEAIADLKVFNTELNKAKTNAASISSVSNNNRGTSNIINNNRAGGSALGTYLMMQQLEKNRLSQIGRPPVLTQASAPVHGQSKTLRSLSGYNIPVPLTSRVYPALANPQNFNNLTSIFHEAGTLSAPDQAPGTLSKMSGGGFGIVPPGVSKLFGTLKNMFGGSSSMGIMPHSQFLKSIEGMSEAERTQKIKEYKMQESKERSDELFKKFNSPGVYTASHAQILAETRKREIEGLQSIVNEKDIAGNAIQFNKKALALKRLRDLGGEGNESGGSMGITPFGGIGNIIKRLGGMLGGGGAKGMEYMKEGGRLLGGRELMRLIGVFGRLGVVAGVLVVAFLSLRKGIEEAADAYKKAAASGLSVAQQSRITNAFGSIGMETPNLKNIQHQLGNGNDTEAILAGARTGQLGEQGQQLLNMADDFKKAMEEGKKNAVQMENSSRAGMLLSIDEQSIGREWHTLLAQFSADSYMFVHLTLTAVRKLLQYINEFMAAVVFFKQLLGLTPTNQTKNQQYSLSNGGRGMAETTGLEKLGFVMKTSNAPEKHLEAISQNSSTTVNLLGKILTAVSLTAVGQPAMGMQQILLPNLP